MNESPVSIIRDPKSTPDSNISSLSTCTTKFASPPSIEQTLGHLTAWSMGRADYHIHFATTQLTTI